MAVPLVAVTNTVVGYLRTWSKENALRASAASAEAEPADRPTVESG